MWNRKLTFRMAKPDPYRAAIAAAPEPKRSFKRLRTLPFLV